MRMTREGAGGKRDLDGVGQRGVKQVSECGRCLWGGPNGIQPPNGTSQGRGRGGSEVGGLAGGGSGWPCENVCRERSHLPFLNKD